MPKDGRQRTQRDFAIVLCPPSIVNFMTPTKTIFQLIWLTIIVLLLFTACSNETAPPLAVEGQPTLVFIFTDP